MQGDVISRFRESIEISAPPQVVWDLITDIRRHAEFAGPKSITKVIEFDGPVEVGSRWIAHEKFGPQKFDAPPRSPWWTRGSGWSGSPSHP